MTVHKKLTERRKADREEMARLVVELVENYGQGATCEVEHITPREVWVHITAKDARVTVDFDGDNSAALLDNYCIPWNIRPDSDARFTDAFGKTVPCQVNQFHRRKAMGFAPGIDALLYSLVSSLNCIARGEAFLSEPSEIAA